MSTPEVLEELRDWTISKRESNGVPALSVAVEFDSIVYRASDGILNLDTGINATDETLFQIGSITKTYTAALILQLADEGRLRIDDPVRKVLPDLVLGDEEAAASITPPPVALPHGRNRR